MNAPSFSDSMIEILPKLRAYALRLVRSPTEADDLVQDALVRAWRFQHSFEEGTNFAAWMLRILRNEHFTQLQKQRARVSSVEGQPEAEVSSQPSQEWSYRCGEVIAALPQLTDDTRDALLRVIGGSTYAEAGRSCGCDENTMKQRVRRARVKLAAITGYEFQAAS
jgi:RNA polymerase sigma-70 factor, ECF subfamily